MLERASMERHLRWELLLLLQELHSRPRRNLQKQTWEYVLWEPVPRQESSSFCRLLTTTHPALLCRICAWREWKGKNIFLTSKPHFGKPSRVFSIPCFLQAQLNFLLTRGGYQTGASNQLAWEIAQPSPGERKERAQLGVANAELKCCLYVCGK